MRPPASLPSALAAFVRSSVLAAVLLNTLLVSSVAAARETVVIVSFQNDNKPAAGNSRSPQVNNTLHDGFEKFLASRNIAYKPRFKFNDVRMPLGYSLGLTDDDYVEALYGYPAVTLVETISSGPASALQKHVRRTDPLANTNNGHSPLHLPRQAGQQAQSSPAATSSDIPAALQKKDTWGPHKMVGADRLHNEGLFGAGVKIAVIDTGIDASHPAFGNCYGKPGCRVVGGASFVSDGNSVTLGSDPRVDCGTTGTTASSWGHGTHVAGVIGAIDTERNFTGMAPLATISPYRIAGCTGSSAPDIAAAAMVRAFYDGMDIISMSFSFNDGWQQGFAASLASSIVSLGLPVVLSEGNGGTSGIFTPRSPTVAKGAFPIAAVQNNEFPGWSFRVSASGTDKVNTTAYVATNPYSFAKNASKSLPVYATSKTLRNLNDACEELPSSTPNLAKYLVLIRRSPNCRPSVQISNVQDKGAKYIMFYNDKTSELVYADEYVDPSEAQASMITNEDGVNIAKNIVAGKKVTMDFSAPQGVVINNTATGGMMGDYSEYGPSWTGAGMPGIAGVGGQVFSTWPLVAGKYAVLEGTSFSCPMVSGALALYQGAKGKCESPEELNAIFTSTSTPIAFQRSAVLESTAHQGGGLLNVYKAVKSTSRISPYQLLLNDTRNFQATQTLTVRNIGKTAQTYTAKHLPAGTLYGQDGSGKGVYFDGPVTPYNQDQASVQFSPASVTVAPGATGTIQATFTRPTISASKLGVYSGFVQLVSSTGELGSLHVPYLGIAVDLAAVPLLNVTYSADNGGLQTQLRDPTGDGQLLSDSKTFNLSVFSQIPSLQYGLNYGSPFARVSLVKPDTAFVPTYRQRAGDTLGPPNAPAKNADGSCKGVPAADLVVPSVRTDVLKDRNEGDPLYVFIGPNYADRSTGTVKRLPDGKVRVLLRALRPNADPSDECAYETYLSRAFTITH